MTDFKAFVAIFDEPGVVRLLVTDPHSDIVYRISLEQATRLKTEIEALTKEGVIHWNRIAYAIKYCAQGHA